MDDQNRFEAYRQKFLKYWTAFLTWCGGLWQKLRAWGKKVAAWTVAMARRLAALLVQAAESIRGKFGQLAAWVRKTSGDLLKEDAPLGRARIWCGGLIAKLRPAREPELPELPQQTEPLKVVEAEPEAPAAAEAVQPALPEEQPAKPEAEQPARLQPVELWEPAEEETDDSELYDTDDSVMGKIRRVLRAIGKWIRRLYKFVMAAPVVYAAVKLALKNMDRLPDLVGLDIQASGEFSYVVTREIAVLGPLALTVFCLALMFCAKKPVLPWVISIFTLVLPLLIWVTNLYA